MSYETIEIQKQKDITTIILNRPELHNAMNEKLMKELTSCFRKLNKDNQTRIIILKGKGKSFSAGADLNWMKSMVKYSKEENIKDSKLLSDLYETIYNSPKPIIGHINGHAFGGGVGLIAVCDITIAPPDKIFAFSEVKLGIIPSVISTYIVKRIGISNLRRLFITGERFNSQYAKEIGLIDYVIPEEQIESEIQKNIDKLKTSNPNAIYEIKRLVEKYQDIDIKRYKEHTVQKISELRISEDGQ
jgi:methylglutaconyl-CoA hydratase